jgi:hypothetical protein
MKIIELTQGRHAIVDDEDYLLISEFKWHVRNGYVATNLRIKERQVPLYLHRLLLGLIPGDGMEADHRSGDHFDNRRENLRIATPAQNQYNQQIQIRLKSSRFKGVHWNRKSKAWRVQIRFKGKQIRIGYFPREDAAAHAYDEVAMKLFGEFAKLNFHWEA